VVVNGCAASPCLAASRRGNVDSYGNCIFFSVLKGFNDE
jgi:hypothetical protein